METVQLRTRVGIVGDFDAGYEIHHTSDRALAQLGLRFQWVASGEVSAQRPAERLAGYAGLLIAPASRPYRSIAGVLASKTETVSPRLMPRRASDDASWRARA